VTGYVGHVLWVNELRELFPDALFIRLHRDPLSNAYSLYRIRKKASSAWFSVFPRECKEVLHRSTHEQVATQVYWLNRRLDAVARDGRTLHISYEQSCRDPNAAIQSVVEFAREWQVSLEQQVPLPDNFRSSVVIATENADTQRLFEFLNRLEEDHGKLRGDCAHREFQE
jgi:hypothetical protein